MEAKQNSSAKEAPSPDLIIIKEHTGLKSLADTWNNKLTFEIQKKKQSFENAIKDMMDAKLFYNILSDKQRNHNQLYKAMTKYIREIMSEDQEVQRDQLVEKIREKYLSQVSCQGQLIEILKTFKKSATVQGEQMVYLESECLKRMDEFKVRFCEAMKK